MHAQGIAPENHSSEQGQFVFEIYPRGEDHSTKHVRIAFIFDELDEVIERLSRLAASILTFPESTQLGRRAIVYDLDGHCVELTEKSS